MTWTYWSVVFLWGVRKGPVCFSAFFFGVFVIALSPHRLSNEWLTGSPTKVTCLSLRGGGSKALSRFVPPLWPLRGTGYRDTPPGPMEARFIDSKKSISPGKGRRWKDLVETFPKTCRAVWRENLRRNGALNIGPGAGVCL